MLITGKWKKKKKTSAANYVRREMNGVMLDLFRPGEWRFWHRPSAEFRWWKWPFQTRRRRRWRRSTPADPPSPLCPSTWTPSCPQKLACRRISWNIWCRRDPAADRQRPRLPPYPRRRQSKGCFYETGDGHHWRWFAWMVWFVFVFLKVERGQTMSTWRDLCDTMKILKSTL